MPDQTAVPGSFTRLLPCAVMLVTPLFFSTNMIFGRLVVPEVAPFTLAFLRWTLAALALAPWVLSARGAASGYLRQAAWHWLLLGFLGMWVCGGGVYLALAHTSATNGTLIYTTAPLMILILERLFFSRPVSLRELAGIAIGFLGVAIIVLRGSLAALVTLDFNLGDLLFVGAALSWAVYSVLLRNRATEGLDTLALFGLIAIAGALLLAPVAAGEWWRGAPMPVTFSAWSGIAGIVVFASLLAFSGFQFGVNRLGAATTGAFMYLLPPYGVGLAVFVLGEPFRAYHAVGIATVLTGLVLATWRRPVPARQAASR
ncbi:MAG: DMT family transporter [Pseudomonadota bacterium]|nr:DMT family transporter [Pseudomonadota bacterium]